MKTIKRLGVILLALAVVLSITPSPLRTYAENSYTYSVDAALSYAAAHWNDGVGLCAEFVSKCVQAGGINIPTIATTTECANAICNATGLQMQTLTLNSAGYATQELDGNILAAGDVVLQWCSTHNVGPHILLCAGYDDQGYAVYYAHNSALNRGRYKLSVNTSYQHTTNCDMGGKVVHLSSISNSGLFASTDAKLYSVGSIATFTFNAPGANSLHLYIYHNGDLFFEGQFAPNATYQRSIPYAGHYAYYIIAHYSSGDIASVWDDFDAYDSAPDKPVLTLEKQAYHFGEPVSISFSNIFYTTTQYLQLTNLSTGARVFDDYTTGQQSKVFEGLAAGSYYAAYQTSNDYGLSEVGEAYFSVYDTAPPKPDIVLQKEVFSTGETITIQLIPRGTVTDAFFTVRCSTNGTTIVGPGAQMGPEAISYELVCEEEGQYIVQYQTTNYYGDSETATKVFQVWSCASGHSYSYAVTTAPTTSATGVLTGTCSRCNGTTTVTLPKLSTTDYNYSVVTAATCTTNGTGRYTWKTTTYGTFYFDVTIPKTGHSYSYAVTAAPTTSSTGVLTGTCSGCNGTATVTLPKLNTTDYNYSIVTAATCTTNGTGRYTWKTTTYGTFYFDVTIPKTGHSYAETVTPPTCTAQGYTTHTCSRCGDSYKDNYTNALGHNYSYTVTTAPTTSATGVLTGTCSRCNGSTTVTLPKLSTTDYNYSVVTAATCTANGTGRYTWKTTTYGTFSFDVTIPKTGHSYADNMTPPTCTAQGYTTHTCSLCGDSYRDSYTNALGHAWDNGVITKPATATEDGVRIYTCTRCGATRTEVIPKTGLVNPFEDVKEGKYYYDAVLWAYYHDPQITGGTDETHFSPNKTCTREQIVTFLWKAKGAPEPTMTFNPFTDVKESKYYYKAVLWAVQNGVTGGVGDGKFGVGQPCTREQAVTFLWKACGSPEPISTNNPFSDVKNGKYYYKAVLWAVENGITSGVSANEFGVGQTCTRGQIVTFLYKALGA